MTLRLKLGLAAIAALLNGCSEAPRTDNMIGSVAQGYQDKANQMNQEKMRENEEKAREDSFYSGDASEYDAGDDAPLSAE